METIFLDGVRIYSPRAEDPHFVLGAIVFDVKAFTEFMKKYQTEDGKIKAEILKSKTGKSYIKLQSFANHKSIEIEAPADTDNIPF